jgi:hypothetical protein
MHKVDPVAVGRVVWPAGHAEHVFGDMAWVIVENFPALHPVHFFVLPSLYFPARHAEHAVVQLGHAVMPLASLAAALHLTHVGEFATLPVPGGHAWQAVLPLKPENFPAAHATHEVPDAMVPGAHALHTVVVPPIEYCSGYGHWVHAPDSVYWPARHEGAAETSVVE